MNEKQAKNTTTEQGSFNKLGTLFGSNEEPKPSYVGRIFNRWLSPPNTNDWVLDADWEQLQQNPLKARMLLYFIVFALIALLLWAANATLNEVTRGDGRVVPSNQLQVVQSYDGGIVKEILTREGQTVNAGDILLKLDPTRFMSTLRENRSQFLSLSAKLARLKALTENTEPVFFEKLVKQAPEIVRSEQNQYAANVEELAQHISMYQQQTRQREHELQEAQSTKEQYVRTKDLIQRELAVTRPLLKSGAISDIDIIRLERQLVEIEGEIKRNESVIRRNESAIKEAKSKIREKELTTTNRWRNELSDVSTELNSLKETESGLADVVYQADLKSPVKGTIKRLFINTIGGVVPPGSDVIEIIPLDDQLIVEAKIKPQDIAFLRPGQTAMVKFTAYDFVIYGGLEAEVTHISADTITDENDETYYVVRLQTDSNSFKNGMQIIPGMTTQVDIITGKKTVLDYILKPLLRATSIAMTER
ncbi:MAG: HlyD family type I secretion periplasmic adaptor subunit [Paraglaciecola chathamensis]